MQSCARAWGCQRQLRRMRFLTLITWGYHLEPPGRILHRQPHPAVSSAPSYLTTQITCQHPRFQTFISVWDLWFSFVAISLPNDWYQISLNNSNKVNNNNDENNKNNNSDRITDFLLLRECTHPPLYMDEKILILQMRRFILSQMREQRQNGFKVTQDPKISRW